MSAPTATPPTPALERLRLAVSHRRGYVPVASTALLLVVLLLAGNSRYYGFLDTQVLLNIFINNAGLLVLAVGMTFVMLTGGIDLSVGAMAALSTMICAWLTETNGWPPLVSILVALLTGAALGKAMGHMVHDYGVQPFMATLAGMFLARGLCFVISTESISISDPFFTSAAQYRISVGSAFITWSVVIAFAVVAIAYAVLHYTRFGRGVYAVGDNPQSAELMALPVRRTVLSAYTVSGVCSALGGVLFTFTTQSGYSLNLLGGELDTIAAVVIGGTVLTGGSGYVLGTVLGVTVLGVIQTIVTFEGTLSSWWTKIVTGVLLLSFVLLQRVLTARRTT
ncbi:galactofuranose ABC transporter, permease protein YjfF [Streptomyces sp. NBC_01013]|uniref:galactofuranose ABC transporter, permease protein YjfF n=1 Tax=Streptomyces sp. NBC_01013 TaxID=2903718 RepID=UPI003866D52D|nr:sugar ABC transporter permease YjfF [Streptomyces sp. NBC_01013]